MIKTKHKPTDGNWESRQVPHVDKSKAAKGLTGYQVVAYDAVLGTSVTIADIFPMPHPVAVNPANANLIAAAPELLAACKYVAELTGVALSKEQSATLGKRCLAAIKKAKG